MGSLRVLQVALSLNPGGTERLVIELARRTRGECATMVCCLDDRGAWAEELTAIGVPVVTLDRQPGFTPTVGWRIADLARQHGAEVVHCHQYSPFVYGLIAAHLTGLPLVFTEHGRVSDSPPSLKRRLVNPLLGRLGAASFAVSAHLREHMVAEGFPASKIGVIRNGVDPGLPQTAQSRRHAREQLGVPIADCVIGTAARLDPVKDLATLIEAFDAARAHGHVSHLVIFGDGPQRSALESLAAARGISTSVLLTGHRGDVRPLLHALDVFVNCSLSEGISLTILEAMATGLPIVATAVGGTPEIISDGSTGLLVPARNVSALAEAIDRLAGEPCLRHTMGEGARRTLLESYTLDAMISAYVAQYRRVARKDA